MVRLITAVSLLLATMLAIAACGSDDDSQAQKSDTPLPAATSEQGSSSIQGTDSLENNLALIPDSPLFREHLLIDDLASRRAVMGVDLPSADTPESELWQYTLGLIDFPNGESIAPITRDHLQLISGFPEHVRTMEGIGFDIRHVDQSLHVRGTRDRRAEIVLGRFDAELTDRLIDECTNCVPVQRLSHQDVDYYAWAVGDRSGEFRHAPPITDASGEGGYFWFTDTMAVRTLHQADMERLIELSAGNASSLLDDEDYALAASHLQHPENIDATFTGKTMSFSLAMQDLRATFQHQGMAFDRAEVEQTLRGPDLLLPYDLYASSVRFENGEFIVVSILVSAEEDSATANTERVRARIENGRNLRGTHWLDIIDSYDIKASGRVLTVELRSSDSTVTFLRSAPTDSPSSLIPLYATLFAHEDTAASAAKLTPLLSPTYRPVNFPATEPDGKVGEQEPACMDRGGAWSYRDGYNRVYLMTNPPEPGVTDAQAIAQQLCMRGGTWVPDGRLIVIKAKYSGQRLKEWRDHPALMVDGINSRGIDVKENRVTIGVNTPYAAEQLRKSIEASEVPLDAVFIRVNEQFRLNNPPVIPASETGLGISVSFSPEVVAGEDVVFEVVITNRTDKTIEIEHGHPSEVDIVVLTTDGTQVWRHQVGARWGVGMSTEIQAGGEARFAVMWSPQLDQDGFPLPPGDYLVRGFADPLTYENGRGMRNTMSTAPVPLRIVEG